MEFLNLFGFALSLPYLTEKLLFQLTVQWPNQGEEFRKWHRLGRKNDHRLIDEHP